MRYYALLYFACLSWTPCSGAVVEYTNKAAWQSAAGNYTTITFAELPPLTLVTTQYSHLGATFTDGTDYTDFDPTLFPNDGYGMHAALDNIWIEFSDPLYAIGAEFPGTLRYSLYAQGQLIYTTEDIFGGSGVGFFGGVVSDQPFDRVRIFDPLLGLSIDDLFFGPPIPAPATLVVLFTAAIGCRQRRSRV